MKISLLTPTYNRLDLIKRLYLSLENQVVLPFEWIVIDDGSLDDTDKWLNNIKKTSKFKIKLIKQSNQGKSKAVKNGLKIVSGDYIGIIDSDDELVPSALEILTYNINSNCKFISYIGFCKDKNPNLEKGIHSWDSLLDLTRNELWGIHRYDKINKIDFAPYSNEKFYPEYNVWTQINYNFNLLYINEPLRVYHPHEGPQLSNQMWKLVLKNKKGYLEYFKLKLKSPYLNYFEKRKIYSHQFFHHYFLDLR